jgi:head-tail adaptor
MSDYQSGLMRTRVELQRRTTTQGTRGESLNEWQTLGVRDCRFEYLSGRKLELARELFARASVRVELRKPFNFDLTVRDRAIIGGLILTVGSCLPSSEKFDDLVLLCEVEQ